MPTPEEEAAAAKAASAEALQELLRMLPAMENSMQGIEEGWGKIEEGIDAAKDRASDLQKVLLKGHKVSIQHAIAEKQSRLKVYKEWTNMALGTEKAISTNYKGELKRRLREFKRWGKLTQNIEIKLAKETQRKIRRSIREDRTKKFNEWKDDFENTGMMKAIGFAGQAYSGLMNNPLAQFAGDLSAQRGITRGALAGAGGAGEAIGGAAGADKFFGPAAQDVLGPAERLKLFNEVAKQAVPILEEDSKALQNMIGMLAFTGNSIEDSTRIQIDAWRRLRMGSEGVTQTWNVAGQMQERLGLHTNETAELMLDLSESLRRVGADSSQAYVILDRFDKEMKSFGQTISTMELRRAAQGITEGITGLPPSRLLGLMQFATGRSAMGMSGDEITETLAHPIELASDVFKKILDQGPQGVAGQLLATEAIAPLFGIAQTDTKNLDIIRQAMLKNTNEEIIAAFERSDPSGNINIGNDRLRDMKSPLEMIQIHTENALSPLASIADKADTQIELLRTIAGVGAGAQVVGAAASAYTGIQAARFMSGGAGVASGIALGGTAAMTAGGAVAAGGGLYVGDRLRQAMFPETESLGTLAARWAGLQRNISK